MANRIEVALDQEHQIIRQFVDGFLAPEDFARLLELTGQCAAALRDPGDVRVLVHGPGLGRTSARTRRMMIASLEQPALTRVAIYEATPIGRVMLRFIAVAAGVDKARGFATEAEALDWLLS